MARAKKRIKKYPFYFIGSLKKQQMAKDSSRYVFNVHDVVYALVFTADRPFSQFQTVHFCVPLRSTSENKKENSARK